MTTNRRDVYKRQIRDNEPGLYPVGDLSIQAFEDDYVAMRMIQDYYTVAGSGEMCIRDSRKPCRTE